MSRVNVEQTLSPSKTRTTTRPLPPSTPPPAAPAQVQLAKKELSSHSDDDLSTMPGSLCGLDSSECASSPCRSSPISSPRTSEVPAVVTRDELLYFRQRVRTSNSKGLHCVSKDDSRLPQEKPEPIISSTKERKPLELKSKSKPVGLPPGLSLDAKPKTSVCAPPGLAMGSPSGPEPYTPAAFRKEMMVIFKDLALDKNVGRAVRRVRMHKVPVDRQAAELADALTYALEETRGAVRRSFVAFVAGLGSAFEKEKCIEGFQYFFLVGYGDLEDEVPKLSRIVDIELLPSLRSVFSDAEMDAIRN